MDEMLGGILLTVHNLHFLLDLMRRAREAIAEGRYAAFERAWMESEAADDYGRSGWRECRRGPHTRFSTKV